MARLEDESQADRLRGYTDRDGMLWLHDADRETWGYYDANGDYYPIESDDLPVCYGPYEEVSKETVRQLLAEIGVEPGQV